jgi:hypothetical protein
MVPDLISLITKFNPIKIYSKTCLKWHLFITNQFIKGSLIFPIND